MREIDFTACPRIHSRAYNGANGKKIAVSFEGSVWMLKFPPSAADKPNDLSYSNSCISEHLGSTVFRLLGVPAQETRLGTHVNGRRKIVCACRDFTVPGVRFYDFCSIKNTVIDSETGGHGTELSDVLTTIDLQHFVDPVAVRRRFWDMFVVDALLGNFDRHNGNWGFLVDERTGQSELAPVFDYTAIFRSGGREGRNSLRPQPPCAGNGLTCANESQRVMRFSVRQDIQLL